MPIITGSLLDDILTGTLQGDEINGLDGNDTMSGEGGNDLLLGGSGHDALDGGLGNDRLIAGLGVDSIWGGEGDDEIIDDDQMADLLIDGGAGEDYLALDQRSTVADITLSFADPTLEQSLFDATIRNVERISFYGGSGLDDVTGGLLNDELYGFDGNDTLSGGGGDDYIGGGDGNNLLFGGLGEDSLIGGPGDDTIEGDDGHDHLDGREGSNSLSGGAGDDTLVGVAGTFGQVQGMIDGGPGIDRASLDFSNSTEVLVFRTAFLLDQQLEGTTIRDIEQILFLAGSNNDHVSGGHHDDQIHGNGGDDTLIGGAGDDDIDGGAGSDLLFGGTGADTFAFSFPSHSAVGYEARDVIRDFTVGEDKIDLFALEMLTETTYALVEDFTGMGAGEFNLRQYGPGAFTMVTIDTDGDAKADVQINVFTNGIPLTTDDFLL